MKKKYLDYVNEIKELKEKYNLTAEQVLVLEILSLFEVYGSSYHQVLKEFKK